jgi:fused signal recognition particle receptor
MADDKPGLFKRIFSFAFGKRNAPPPQGPQAEAVADEEAVPPPESRAEAVAETRADEAPPPAAETDSQAHASPIASSPPARKASAGKTGRQQDRSAKGAGKAAVAKVDAASAPKAKQKPVSPLPTKTGAPRKPAHGKSGGMTPTAKAAPPPQREIRPKPETPAPLRIAPATVPAPRSGKVKILEPQPRAAVAPAKEEARSGWFGRLRRGLSRTSSALAGNIASVISGRKLDAETLAELEDILIQADLGPETATRIVETLAAQRLGRDITDEQVREAMAAEIGKSLAPVAIPLELDLSHRPHVILVVGVNGTGKTTTIGKLAAKLKAAGLSPLLVAGDTFRAAAIEQLAIWGERTGSPVVKRTLGADPAGLAFDAWQQARDGGHDVMLMDTAGRLHNRAELMAELEKIVRVLKKRDPSAPHTVLLTLDATTGQNALRQVEIFRDTAGVNGLVMTKLDGTARGGILVAIAAKFGLPVFFVGVGETVDDLEPFEAEDFARSIAGLGEREQA